MNEGEVYFKLIGDDFDPDEITRLVGLQPTRTNRKGKLRAKFDAWCYSSGKVIDEVIDIYEMSSRLIEILEPKTSVILEAIERFRLSAELQIILWITMDDSKSTPAIGFESETIAFLNSVGASIDIDTYRNSC